MTDSVSQSNCIVFLNSEPRFELTGEEIIYPLSVATEAGSEAKIYVHLSPYLASELKAVLGKVTPSFKMTGRIRLHTEVGDRTAYRELTDKHFVGLSNVAIDEEGTEAPAEAKGELWRSNPSFQERAAVEGYGGIAIEAPENAPVSAKFVLMPTRADTLTVKTSQSFIVPDVGETIVHFAHTLQKEAKGHRNRYDSATLQNETNTRTSESWIEINYDVLEMLYNELVKSVDGYVLKGQPCTEANKAEWVKLIPLWHKLQVVHAQFDRTLVKN